MKQSLLLLLYFITLTGFQSDNGFKNEQLRHSRVKAAFQEKEDTVKIFFAAQGITFEKAHLFFRVFKAEQEMEVFARNGNTGKFTLIKRYQICMNSGEPGPKRRQGDYQIPEGFYHINVFNPYSSYHLSMGINYPNESDKKLGYKQALGGDIYIHGRCVTIGCITFSDEDIKEIYISAVQAKSNGQNKIPVHIFPCRMNEENMKKLTEIYKEKEELLKFWNNIKQGYDLFENTKTIFSFSVEESGYYKF